MPESPATGEWDMYESVGFGVEDAEEEVMADAEDVVLTVPEEIVDPPSVVVVAVVLNPDAPPESSLSFAFGPSPVLKRGSRRWETESTAHSTFML